MKPPTEQDPLARGLADLPLVPIDPARADVVRRRARAALAAEAAAPGPSGQRSAVWSTALLPGLLLGAGVVYVWDAVLKIAQIYGAG